MYRARKPSLWAGLSVLMPLLLFVVGYRRIGGLNTTFGIVWPHPVVETVVSVSSTGNALAVICDDKSMGLVQVADDVSVPVALWPTLAQILPLHPAILKALRERGKMPMAIQSDFAAFDREAHVIWTLNGSETVDVPFPLVETYRNVTAEQKAEALPVGLAALAHEVANGTAGSDPPQAAAWLAHLEELARLGAV